MKKKFRVTFNCMGQDETGVTITCKKKESAIKYVENNFQLVEILEVKEVK